MIPWKNVAVSAIFCLVSIANAHTTGIGIISMTSPSITLGTLNHFATIAKSTHFPLIPMSQAEATGEHWKMATNAYEVPVVSTMKATRPSVRVKFFICEVKTRR